MWSRTLPTGTACTGTYGNAAHEKVISAHCSLFGLLSPLLQSYRRVIFFAVVPLISSGGFHVDGVGGIVRRVVILDAFDNVVSDVKPRTFVTLLKYPERANFRPERVYVLGHWEIVAGLKRCGEDFWRFPLRVRSATATVILQTVLDDGAEEHRVSMLCSVL